MTNSLPAAIFIMGLFLVVPLGILMAGIANWLEKREDAKRLDAFSRMDPEIARMILASERANEGGGATSC